MTTVILAAAIVGAVGIIIGVLLGFAGKVFAVDVDERTPLVREQLPGNNCGGCGYAGCDALAKAIVDGEAAPNGCPAGCTAEQVAEIGRIMGVSAEAKEKKVMFVKCSGTCDKAADKYNYVGAHDCRQAVMVPGRGPKACTYGCLGFGSCQKVCDFDAIRIKDGVAIINPDKCVNCGKCAEVCPNNLIERVPYSASVKVLCNNNDKGKFVKPVCKTGCLGCGLCAKFCETGAITVENNLAHIDQSKCTGCGICVEKCPAGCIIIEK